jgi:hypothetical protein
MIEGVLFDLETVLLRPPSRSEIDLHMEGVRLAYDNLVAGGAELPEFHAVFRLVFGALRAVQMGLAFGNLREIDLAAEAGSLLGKAVPGLSEEELERTLGLWFAPFGSEISYRTQARGVLGDLRGKGLLLHGGMNTPWPRKLVGERLGPGTGGDLLDGFTLSSEVGHRRPNLFFYESALSAMDLSGPEVAYVSGGGQAEVEGAQEAGMVIVGPGEAQRDARLADLPTKLAALRG